MKAAIAPIMLLLVACASVPPTLGSRPTPLGGTVRADGLAIRPLRVVEDSRCPIDAVCVWAGRLVVRTEIRSATSRETRDLELGKKLVLANGTLTLQSAHPPRRTDAAIDPADYRFTFNFDAGI